MLFLYTSALDSVMHGSGPESGPTRARLAGYDRQITFLTEKARRRYREVRVFVFGDHGMAPVSGVHDLWGALAGLGLRMPNDYVFFLDSTMARFWFRHDEARARVDALLEKAPYGRILPPRSCEGWGPISPTGPTARASSS